MIYLRTLRKDIAFITKIFEAMGHMAVVSTLDRQNGILRVMYGEGFAQEVKSVIETLPCIMIEFNHLWPN